MENKLVQCWACGQEFTAEGGWEYCPWCGVLVCFVSKVYLSNSFSLNMLTLPEYRIYTKKVTKEEALRIWTSASVRDQCVGHESTVQVLNKMGFNAIPNRKEIKLLPGDTMIVFQMRKRLPEGKILSEDEIEQLGYDFYYVEVL